MKGKHRTHEYIEPTEFLWGMSKLISDGVDLKALLSTNIEPGKTVKGNASETKKRYTRSKSEPKSA